jgi:cation diffusion facilitator family transporter
MKSDAETGKSPVVLSRGPQRVAVAALVGGVAIMAMKFGVFAVTNSAAVLGDAMESIVNLATAGMAIFSTWYAARPADREHPYGHGKVEFVAVGAEGAMIVFAALAIMFESSRRLVRGAELHDLDRGLWLLAGVSVLVAGLALFVWGSGKRLQSPTLIADGKHLMTDAFTTSGTLIGLSLVRLTGHAWIDPAMGIVIGLVIVYTGVRLLRESFGGLMDEMDMADDTAIRAVLDEEVAAGRIRSYHKVRHRHTGAFHWVDMHIQVPGEMTVDVAHQLATEIEHRIERRLGQAKATAHIEPS